MVLITVQKLKDFLIERLQGNQSEIDFESFHMERGDTLDFSWSIGVGDNDLLDVNDIEFYTPERYRNRHRE